MNKLSLTLEVSKIPRNKIYERRYYNQSNDEVVVKELKLDVIPLKEKKLVKDGDTWQMFKTHFIAIPQTKEEREEGKKSLIIGSGITFEPKGEFEERTAPKKIVETVEDDEVNPDDIPF